jgi:hypothetical protein
MLQCFRVQTLTALGLALLTRASGADQVLQKMTVEDASKLVYEVARVHDTGAEVIRRRDDYDPDFFYFEIVAVNPWTGDVWNPSLCEQVTSPHLKKMQSRIRTKLHLTDKDYTKLRQRKPICS